jgi:hypothetical protein
MLPEPVASAAAGDCRGRRERRQSDGDNLIRATAESAQLAIKGIPCRFEAPSKPVSQLLVQSRRMRVTLLSSQPHNQWWAVARCWSRQSHFSADNVAAGVMGGVIMSESFRSELTRKFK